MGEGNRPEERVPGAEELARLGLYDPSAADAPDRLALIRYAVAQGATLDEVAAAGRDVGQLALDLKLRPRLAVTVAEVVADATMEWPKAERLLNALGLPSDPAARVTEDERVATELMVRAVSGLLGFESTLQMARAAGSAMARVAEALVTALRLRYEVPQQDAGAPYSEIVMEYSGLAETVLPNFVRMLDAVLRRQIVGVAERMWGTDTDRSAVTLPRTVGFADLVGYTSSSARMSARELTTVLMEFDGITAEVVLRGGGQIVKTIGDEAMFVTESPAAACRIATDLAVSFGTGDLPPVRVGLATGDVVSVFGDIYGPDVNLAARLVSAAEPSTVLVSRAVHDACRDEFDWELPDPIAVKGLDAPVPVARLRPRR